MIADGPDNPYVVAASGDFPSFWGESRISRICNTTDARGHALGGFQLLLDEHTVRARCGGCSPPYRVARVSNGALFAAFATGALFLVAPGKAPVAVPYYAPKRACGFE